MISEMSSGTSAPDTLSIQNAMKQMEKNFQGVMNNNHVEDSVDSLVKKLEAQGKKFKIVYEDEESEEDDQPTSKTKKKKTKPVKNKAKQKQVESDSEEEIINDISNKKSRTKPHKLVSNDSVDFAGPIQELEKLEKEKKDLKDHKQQIEDQLKEQQKEVEIEKQQKKQLENLLSQMQQKLVFGGKALEEKEKIRAKEVREIQLKLEKQKQKEHELFEENKKQEEEMLMKEQQYLDLQEEVNANRNILKELRSRYKAALQEIQDLKNENQDVNEDNLVTIRDQAGEIEFYQKLVKNLLKPEELSQVRARSQHLEDGWIVPPFVLKKHELNFPKLSLGKGKAMVEDDLNQRDMEFEASYSTEKASEPSNIKQNSSMTQKIKKNASSKKALNANEALLSPSTNQRKEMKIKDYANPLSQSGRQISSKHGEKHKKNISAQPLAATNLSNEYAYFQDDEESK